jgi:heme A synthase
MKAYPRWFYVLLLLGLLLLAVTGILLVPNSLSMRFELDIAWALDGSRRLLSAALHTTASFLILFIVGALFPIHMRAGIRAKKNLRSGLTLVACFLVLSMTGIGLFYFGGEQLLIGTAFLHMLAGGLLLLLFALHFFRF